MGGRTDRGAESVLRPRCVRRPERAAVHDAADARYLVPAARARGWGGCGGWGGGGPPAGGAPRFFGFRLLPPPPPPPGLPRGPAGRRAPGEPHTPALSPAC